MVLMHIISSVKEWDKLEADVLARCGHKQEASNTFSANKCRSQSQHCLFETLTSRVTLVHIPVNFEGSGRGLPEVSKS
jgi:hypothetical protein